MAVIEMLFDLATLPNSPAEFGGSPLPESGGEK
jgi:hypothetical protein